MKQKSDSATHDAPAPSPSSRGRFSIKLSFLFLLLTFAISTVVAFSIGWVARLILLSNYGLTPYDSSANAQYEGAADSTAAPFLALPTSGGMSKKGTTEEEEPNMTMSGKKVTQLPSPKILEGKEVPLTTYASKTFQMAGASTSNTLHIDRSTAEIMTRSRKEFDGGPDFSALSDEADEAELSGELEGGNEDNDGWVPACDEKACSRGKEKSDQDGHNDDSDGLHLPAGQHLLIDFKDVDSNFLNSEERLASAMIELCNESKLTLLSYHCHSLVPIGVSCAGVLLESHVAFHTWPMEGVITMDLFTCGGGLLVPLLPSIEKMFGVPSAPGEGETEADVPPPTMLWSHKLRGFREGFAAGYVRSKNPLDGSLGRYVLGKLDFDIKRPLLSTETAVQSVNIYEVMEPKSRDINSYIKSISGGEEDSYEVSYPGSFGPDKILFLDGIIQSTLYGDAPYHESIVHPAMMAHSNPKRVAIIGGGEGATLREVLKYKSVEEVVILEIDEELVQICAEYMPEWSDCSDIEGIDAKSCFEDSRARVLYVDAFKWFIDTFGKAEQGTEKEFDVIIMDALDPNTSVEIAGGLYNDMTFIDSISNGLSHDGVFVVQLGKAKMSKDPPDEFGRSRDTALMIDQLDKSGFQSIHTYDEGHSHFYMPWSYLVAFKDYETKAGWHRTAPEIEIQIKKRLHKTKSGMPTLRYFDAATMGSHQVPSKASEITYCRKEEFPEECDDDVGIDPEYVHLPASEYLKVGKSSVGEYAGRGLFAAKDIPDDTTIAIDQGAKSFHFPPLTWSVIEELEEWVDEDEFPYLDDKISAIYMYGDGYGHGAKLLGKTHFSVDSGVLLFMNHGCDGSSNYGVNELEDEDHDGFTEQTIDLTNLSEVNDLHDNTSYDVYSPVSDRHWRHKLNSGDYALRDIKKGEEILTDYLSFSGELTEEDVIQLRTECAGGVGAIKEYESESS